MPVAAEQTLWTGFDAQTVKNGSSSYWSTDLTVHTHTTNGKGLIAPAGSGTKTTSDTAFATTSVSKREWGKLTAKSAITSTMAEAYDVRFKLTGIEGAYATTFGGWYVYLRSSSVTNYLDNRFAIILRRNQNGITQIGLKTASQGATTDTYLPIGVSGVTLLDTDIKIVDNFTDNIIKIYATDSTGTYQLIGTVTLNLTANSATLTNAEGSTQTRTGYGETISGTSSTPMFLTAENSIMLSHLAVKYPVFNPAGVTVSNGAGVYVGYPEVELSTTDEEGVIYYTLDGSNPIENGVEYTGGYLDFSGAEIPGTVTLKVTEELGGEYIDVETYVYTLYPENAVYELDTSQVSAGTSADFGYNNKFITQGDNGFAAENTLNSWTHVYSKFGVPLNAGGMEYRFKAENMSADGATHFGMFVSLQASESSNMVSNTVPYLYLGVDKIGFRNANGWGAGASTTMGYAEGVSFDSGTHYIRIVNRFDDESEVYIDGMLVATVTIEEGVMTVTNGDGESITREGVVTATNLVYANLSIYKGSQYTIVRDFTVLYPHEEQGATDRTELGELIEEVEALNSDDYSSATYEALMLALEEAKEVYGNYFVFQEGVDEAYNTLLEAKNSLAEPEIVSLILSCTDVTVYGKGTLSAVAEYDNGTEAALTEGITYTSLTENIAVVEGNVVKGIATGTATIKAEYDGAEEEITVEVAPIPLVVVENTADEPESITEAEAENYDKVFYAYETVGITVPSGADGEAEIYIRAQGEGNATVKVNGAVAGEIAVSDLQNYIVTTSLEKGLNTVEIITEAEIFGVYVQKISGTLPNNVLTGITLSEGSYTFVVTDEGADLPEVTAQYYNGEANGVTATFLSANPGIAIVENGKIVPAGNDGETTITVTYTEEGITKKAEIFVSVTLSENIRILSGIVNAEANATKGYAEGNYSESFKPQFAIDGENGTVWTSGSAGEYLAGHGEDAAVYLAVKLDGLHSVDRVMLSLADDTVDTDKILGVWVDTRRMDGLSPYENDVVFIEKADLTVLTDDIGKTVKLVFDQPKIVQYIAVAFDKDQEISVREIKLYEDTNVTATEDAESLSFEGIGIADGKITLTQGDEIAVTVKKNYPRLDSVVINTYTTPDSDIAWIEGGVLKTDVSGEVTITTTVDGLTATLVVTVVPMADIVCLNPHAFINMSGGDEAVIDLSDGLFKVRYLSENTSVATVNAEGKVTAAGNGRTRIKIYSEVSGTQPVYISVYVADAAESGVLISEDFEGSTSLPANWSYFVWQGENKQSIETLEGQNYMNIGNDWIGGAIHNTIITAEKYTVETNAGVTGSDGIIYLRLPEICSPVLTYTGETDYATSGRRYGRDGVAFNLLGNGSFGITFRIKETDSNGYPKAVNIAVPVPAGATFPDGEFADFRFDDTGDNIHVTINGISVCKIVFTNAETDSADDARVLADGYVEDAKGGRLGTFNDVSLPGGNYRIGFGSRGKTLYVNDLEVTRNPLPEIANAEEFKVAELGDGAKKISVTQFKETVEDGTEFESADTSVATVDSEGTVSFVGRGQTVIYVFTTTGNMTVAVNVFGEEDVREIVSDITSVASYEEATTLYAELEEKYGMDLSAITSEALSDRFVEELGLSDITNYTKLADIEKMISLAEKVEKIAAKTTSSGSGDSLQQVVMLYDNDLNLDLTDYDGIDSTNMRGKMWTALYNELKGNAINSALIKEKFEAFAADYYEKYLESKDGGGSGGGGSTGGMIYTEFTPVVTEPAVKSYYTDLPEGHWAKGYIESLTDMGVISGYTDKTVNPDGRITREEAVTVIIKAFIKKTAEGTLAEGDPSSEWAVPYLVSAKEKGLLVGDNEGFVNGKNNATRSEMAVLIARLMDMNEGNTTVLESFKDKADIPAWAENAFANLKVSGIINGYEDGSLRPNGYITRAEFFTIIYKIIANN